MSNVLIQNSCFHKDRVPENFDEFLGYFENWLQWQKNIMRKFLWANMDFGFQIRKCKTFSFTPKDHQITIPLKWLQIFHNNIITSHKIQNNNKFLYTFEDLIFWLYHELSHFRDIINENDPKNRQSMIRLFKFLKWKKVSYWDRVIPISNKLFELFNCIDDVIVNKEVVMNIWTNITDNDLNGFYKNNLFADIKKQKWGDYILVNWKYLKYVWDGNWDYIINTELSVDYSKRGFSRAFSYFFLRGFMVKDQKIILPDQVENIIFRTNERTSLNNWSRSIEIIINNMKKYFNDIEKSDNSDFVDRCSKLKGAYLSTVYSLEEILQSKDKIEKLLFAALKKTNTTNRLSVGSLSLWQIVELFTLSSWKDIRHSLDISPHLRYEIIKSIFLPIYEWLLLMDLLTQDIKNKDDENAEWEWDDWEWEWDENTDWEWELENNNIKPNWSSDWQIHESPNIDERLKILEELEDLEKEKEMQKLIKKQVDQSKFGVNSILWWSDVWEVWKQILSHISSEYAKWIEELVDFFIQELLVLDKEEQIIEFSAKKWKPNIGKLINYIAKDPGFSEIDKQRFYDKKESIEKITETLKKIDITFVIDISGSVDVFKWREWMMNIVTTIMFAVFNHIESHIQNLINDPNYKIPVNFVLYWDGIPYSSMNSKYTNSQSSIRMAEMNEKIISLTWWTNDTVWWQKISAEFDNFLSSNPDYIEGIENNERKPVIIQVADTDVSENGVVYLKDTFKKYINPEIIETLPIKRIILGYVDIQEFDEEEYQKRHLSWELWNWDIVRLPNWKYQKKQIGIKNKDEIISQIKALFKNFFADINIKK